MINVEKSRKIVALKKLPSTRLLTEAIDELLTVRPEMNILEILYSLTERGEFSEPLRRKIQRVVQVKFARVRKVDRMFYYAKTGEVIDGINKYQPISSLHGSVQLAEQAITFHFITESYKKVGIKEAIAKLEVAKEVDNIETIMGILETECADKLEQMRISANLDYKDFRGRIMGVVTYTLRKTLNTTDGYKKLQMIF